MAEYRVDIGTMSFSGDSVVLGSLKMATTVDVVGTELAADVFSVVINFEAGAPILFSPADYDGILTEDLYLFASADVTVGDLTQVPYGTPVNLYKNGSLAHKFFVHDIRRTSSTKYQVNALSAVGMLDNLTHMGGVYVNKTAGALIGEIINGAFSYTIEPSVASQKTAGWLPIDTARNNLHQVLFALGITIAKDSDGDLVFKFLTAESPTGIPNSRIFLGGSVGYNALATAVALTEHSYYKRPDTQESQIFTNVGGVWADHLMVQFSAPAYDLRADGLEIHDSGANFAVVSGAGNLLGKLYAHDVRVHQRSIPGVTAIVPNLITSDSDTMVNSLNAMSVLDRLVAFYGSRKTITADLLVDGERAGDVVAFTDAFGDPATGFLASMDARATTIVRANCTIITDYTPTGQGNYYTTMARITSSGTWTVPAGVTHIRIVVIGGGTGGGGGHNGQAGRGGDKAYGGWQTYREESYQGVVYNKTYGYATGDGDEAGHGGSGGSGGAGGMFVVLDMDVTPGETFTVSVGAGGSGGAVSAYDADDTAGTAGTDTSVVSVHGTITSAGGQLVAAGYYDPINNEVYAADGGDGVNGGDGGTTTVSSNNGFSGDDLAGVSGKPGTGAGTYAGGSGGAGLYSDDPDALTIHAGGGGGGGAAQGAAGGAGGAATLSGSTYRGGTGGTGANAAAPAAAGYGCGGNGGHGGGGGGNAGGADLRGQVSGKSVAAGVGGTGGTGSAGANGGNGCVLFYY